MFRRFAANFTRGQSSDRVDQRRIPRPGGEPSREQLPVTPLPPLDPSAPVDYFGHVGNFANSPLPVLDGTGRVVAGTGIRKFVTELPGLGADRENTVGAYLPVAVPDTISYPGCDYYEIGVVEFTQQLHPDLQATRLRGYRQLNNGTDDTGHNTIRPPDRPLHLGPVIMAQRDRPVRLKVINMLPTGVDGRLFLPVDETLPGAGAGPVDGTGYPHNRTVVHLHGGITPWISDGTAHQWFTPAGEPTAHPRGAGYATVPDMPDPGDGAVTLFYPNQQSARLLWFHDQTLGLARLTVYAGQLGLYLLTDPVERELVADQVLPAEQVPLVIQDKTFVPGDTQLAAQDPTWDRVAWGARGSLWFPHVYMPNQNPYNESGRNPVGRWDYGPWSWPPYTGTAHAPTPNPYHDPVTAPWEPPVVPGTPHPCAVPDAFLDTAVVNGCPFPYLRVEPRAYRLRILNGCNDRTLNLGLYYAASNAPMWRPDGTLNDADAGEVPMVPAAPSPRLPESWPTDGRPGGVPDPESVGPNMIQIGNDGGLLPAPVVLPNQPITYRRDGPGGTLINIDAHGLLLGPGERADVVVDFSSAPPSSTIILYNDCPVPLPGFDPRYDHHTGSPDLTPVGGAPPTRAGYGPNTRTIMQFRVAGTPAAPFDLATLSTRLPRAYRDSQPPPIIPAKGYDAACGTATPRNSYVHVQDDTIEYACGENASTRLPLHHKAVQDLFEPGHGRMITALGVELAPARGLIQTTIPLSYADPPTETLPVPTADATPEPVQVWRIAHHGATSRFLHFHGLVVQVVNRVGRDGSVRPPAPNELGWKDTVRIDPMADLVVAMRPAPPDPLPFKVHDSCRLLDPTRAPNARQPFTQVDPGSGEPALISNVTASFGWEYAWQCHPFGQADGGTIRPLVLRVSPAPPTGLTATARPGSPTALPSIHLTWTDNAGDPPATVNTIERATSGDFATARTEIVVPAHCTGHIDSTVTPGVSYHYRIRAENAIGYSTWSDPVSTAVHLLAPTGLVAGVPPTTPLRVTLAWVNRAFATAVQVQRATNPTFSAGVVTRSLTVATSDLDDTATANTTYYYRVRSSYLGAASPWSNVATAVTPARPGKPADPAATATAPPTGTATAELTWGAAAGGVVSGYTIQRATNPSFTAGLATFTVTGTTHAFVNTGLARDLTYYFRVQARNASGTSEFAGPVSVTTPR